MTGDVVRVGAIADVHYGRDAEKRLRPVFEEVARQVDMLLLAGDLTDFGLPEEAQVLARDLTEVVRIPIVAVLGNHDYEGGKEAEVAAVSRTTWALAMVILAGLLAGFLGTLLAAKYVAPALRASAAQQVAAQ